MDMEVVEVINFLRRLILNPVKDSAGKLINMALDRFVTPESIESAIEERVDILSLSLNHYGIGHSKITPLFRIAVKKYWDQFEEYLTDAEKMIKLLSKRHGCEEILNTERGVEYINWCCESSYNRLYDFIWLDKPFFES